MKYMILLCLTLISLAGSANQTNEKDLVLPSEAIEIFCVQNKMTLQSPVLLESSMNGIQSVHLKLKTAEVCQKNKKELNSYFGNTDRVPITLRERKYVSQKYFDETEECDGEVCSIEVEDREESVTTVTLFGFEFETAVVVPLSRTTVEWMDGTCPPWSPDCDL